MNSPAPGSTNPSPSDFVDELRTCDDCGMPYLFSAQDQAFYEERGFSPPRRCKPCRKKRKAAAQPPGHSPYATPPGAAQAGASEKPRFKVVCFSCGVETSVPFKPDPTRPVFCQNCYQVQRRQKDAPAPRPANSKDPAEAAHPAEPGGEAGPSRET